MTEDNTIRLDAFGTPIKIKPPFWGAVAGLWAGMTWAAGKRRTGRSLPARLGVGLLSSLALISADLGHAVAHIFSAKAANAPMDEIRLNLDMPRTIYFDDRVSPAQHRMRALGGPMFSGLSLLVALVSRSLAPRESTLREVLDYSVLGHGLIFLGALAPLPMVDGGSILKWTLVEKGTSEGEAEVIVQEVDVVGGAAVSAAGALALLAGKRRFGLGLLAGGLVALAAGLGKIR